MKNKDNIFSKNNYDVQLEEVLDDKNFSDEIKSLILNIWYKIDIAYKDYSKIKIDAKQKNDMMMELIGIIKNNCETIEIVDPNSKKIKYFVDKKAKRVEVFPNENPLLQAVYYISTKSTEGINDIVDKAVTKVINKGYAIDGTEIIRDYNGWSWTNAIEDNMSKLYNLIYQDLIILIGRNGVEQALKSRSTRESIAQKLQQLYGEKKAKEIKDKIEACCVLIYMKNNKEKQKAVIEYVSKIKRKLKVISNKPEYIAKITKKNNESLKIIGQIEKILKDEKLLQRKYLKPGIKEKYKIIDNYKKYLMAIQKQRLSRINKNASLISPVEYAKRKNNLENDIELLKSVENNQNKRDIIYNYITELQKNVVAIFNEKIDGLEQRKDLLNKVYEIRYYKYLPVKNDKSIRDLKELDLGIRNVQRKLLSKLSEGKIIERFSLNEGISYKILKYIFDSKTTNMNKIYLKMRYRDKKLYLEYYDEEAVESEIDIVLSKDDIAEIISKKMEKKIKIFI